MPKYIDIHAHINFSIFDDKREEVLRRALDNDTWVINIGTQLDTSLKAVQMTEEYTEGMYATIGLHPIHISSSYADQDELGICSKEFYTHGEIFDKEKYRGLFEPGKVVAIGECGLDYFHLRDGDLEKQKEVFIKQIELANELNIPLMLHLRNSEEDLSTSAYQEALKILKKHAKVKGVVHFFAGELKDAIDFIDFGFYISFAGVITYPPKKTNPRNINVEEIIKQIPLDKIMADTDSPYVAPVPHRGKVNEPLFVKEIVGKIAQVKGLSENEVTFQIVKNAKKLFGI
jgi:TatD DNase family protein